MQELVVLEVRVAASPDVAVAAILGRSADQRLDSRIIKCDRLVGREVRGYRGRTRHGDGAAGKRAAILGGQQGLR